MVVAIKDPAEFAVATWKFGGKTYYQVGECCFGNVEGVEPDRCLATAIEEDAERNADGEYQCVELYFTVDPNGTPQRVEEVNETADLWDGVNGGFVYDDDEKS